VGRARELAALRAHIDDATPLVTVTGPPGIGKSAVVSRALEDAEGTRAIWVSGPFETRAEICGAVARAMGVQPVAKSEADLEASVAKMLDDAGEIVVVLDDFDRGAKEASLLSSWLAAASELSIIVTSRARLRCAEEHVIEIGPLETAEASELFEARAAQTGDPITDDDRALLGDLAARLDGIPLALELAAAQHRVLSVRDMIARGAAQTSLRATLDDAWTTALSDAERALLSQCTVFRGSFTAAAAEAIAPGKSVIELLDSLRDKSWLFVRRTPNGPRFLLGTAVRDCAAQKLAPKDEEAARLRHREHYAALALSPSARTLEDDHVEIIAAADAFDAAGERETEARLLVGFVARSFSFGYDVLERVSRLAVHPDSQRFPASLRVALLLAHARVGFLGDTARPLSHVEIHELAVASGDARLIVESGVQCINEQLIEGRIDARVTERMRAIAESPGADPATRAWWHVIAGKIAEHEGDMKRAASEATRACELGKMAGDLRVELNARSVRVYALIEAGDLDGALEAATRAVERSEPAGAAAQRFTWMALASVKQCRGDFAGAEEAYTRARTRWVGSAVGWTCACLSAVARHQRTGEDVRAEMAFAIAEVDRMGRGRVAAPVRALLALLEWKYGDHARAREAIDRALADPFDAPGERFAIDLCRAYVMNDASAKELTRKLEAGEVARTVEAFVALALVREAPRSSRATVVVDARGRFFEVDGTRVSCGRRPVMRRILAELVRASREGTTRTASELVAAVWPGERFVRDAAHNRLRVLIFRMRQEGLRETLAGTDEGYSLAPPFEIRA
jgi:predicted ATPase